MDKKITELQYREQQITFYEDNIGDQVYAIWNNIRYDFGRLNVTYIQDMQHVIDNKLDTVHVYDGQYKIIKHNDDYWLMSGKRILQVYPAELNMTTDDVITAGKNFIETYIKNKQTTVG